MSDSDPSLLAAWKKSRHGAWAGGGYHYQHLVGTLIIVRQWAGLAPSGYLVPEGLEDCVLELPERRIWLQIKSRNHGKFSEAEVESIFAAIGNRASELNTEGPTNSVVILNQECVGIAAGNTEQLFDDLPKNLIVCDSPKEQVVNLLTRHLETAEIIAEGIASDLYELVADASSANASVPYDDRRRISTTEIERRIFQRLEAEDPSAIDQAVASGALEPIDFQTPVSEPSFYLGVKAKPGHVAARLILPRVDETREITSKLKERRHVLVAGPSGAGKSALMWLSAGALACEFRWFQITARATASDADSIVRFVRARRPTHTSPIGLALDEIGSGNSDLWDVLLRLLRGLPEVYVLGSVRTEDISLITNHSDTDIVQASLDERLAESIWKKLANKNHTTWQHWLEPFEQSQGLMLEYIHILTQGDRLAALIGDQVHQRERENRSDELAIIRCTGELCRHGGEVDAAQLFKLLDIPAQRASVALKRLIDEHLVHESRPGVLGGLHTLRSEALSNASHDGAVYLRTKSLWQGLLAVTDETLPRIIQSAFTSQDEQDNESTLQKLAELLGSSDDVEKWSAVLTGLGLATLERCVALFVSILEEHDVPRAHWSLASMFFDPNTSVPDMSELVQWQALKNAVETFRAAPKADLRGACLEFLSKEVVAPTCGTFEAANRLLSSAVPIAGGQPVPITVSLEAQSGGEQNIENVAALLSTAFQFDPSLAKEIVGAFGGEETLLDWFYRQTPWVSKPTTQPDGQHGRTVRADWYLVADDSQGDPHEKVVAICETLIAISPTSNAAASDVIDPKGRPIKVGDHTLVSKNIPRKNLPSKSRVAWNAAFRHIMLARAAGDSLTDYARRMSELVLETEKLFRSYSEKWITGKKIRNVNALAASIEKISLEVNSLAYSEPRPVSTSMTAIRSGTGDDDSLGALLVGVLGNLVPRMNNLASEGGPKGAAAFAASLAEQARIYQQSDIWRVTSAPPLKKLGALAERLYNVSCILHEMAHDDSPTATKAMVSAAKRAMLSKSVHQAARHCRVRADRRLQNTIRNLKKKLENCGCHIECCTRPVEDTDSFYWPPVEVAVLVKIAGFEADGPYLDEAVSAAQDVLGSDWCYSVAPIMNGKVLAAFAILPCSSMMSSQETVLPDVDFAEKWRRHIDHQFHSSFASDAFDKAMGACMQLSGVFSCRNLAEMNPKEEDVTEKIINDFRCSLKRLGELAAATELDEVDWALDKVDATWNQLIAEFEAVRDGDTVTSPLFEGIYAALSGQTNEWLDELAAVRMLLRQAEIRALSAEAEVC